MVLVADARGRCRWLQLAADAGGASGLMRASLLPISREGVTRLAWRASAATAEGGGHDAVDVGGRDGRQGPYAEDGGGGGRSPYPRRL